MAIEISPQPSAILQGALAFLAGRGDQRRQKEATELGLQIQSNRAISNAIARGTENLVEPINRVNLLRTASQLRTNETTSRINQEARAAITERMSRLGLEEPQLQEIERRSGHTRNQVLTNMENGLVYQVPRANKSKLRELNNDMAQLETNFRNNELTDLQFLENQSKLLGERENLMRFRPSIPEENPFSEKNLRSSGHLFQLPDGTTILTDPTNKNRPSRFDPAIDKTAADAARARRKAAEQRKRDVIKMADEIRGDHPDLTDRQALQLAAERMAQREAFFGPAPVPQAAAGPGTREAQPPAQTRGAPDEAARRIVQQRAQQQAQAIRNAQELGLPPMPDVDPQEFRFATTRLVEGIEPPVQEAESYLSAVISVTGETDPTRWDGAVRTAGARAATVVLRDLIQRGDFRSTGGRQSFDAALTRLVNRETDRIMAKLDRPSGDAGDVRNRVARRLRLTLSRKLRFLVDATDASQ